MGGTGGSFNPDASPILGLRRVNRERGPMRKPPQVVCPLLLCKLTLYLVR